MARLGSLDAVRQAMMDHSNSSRPFVGRPFGVPHRMTLPGTCGPPPGAPPTGAPGAPPPDDGATVADGLGVREGTAVRDAVVVRDGVMVRVGVLVGVLLARGVRLG